MRKSISVITPTFDRPGMLPSIYRCFASQTATDIEWIVVDDSAQPSEFLSHLADPRVRYIHLPDRMSSGDKRNLAIQAAVGEIIAQFDDDDYYAPTYLEVMTRCMANEGADFCKLAAFFLYSRVLGHYGYWDLREKDGINYVWSKEPGYVLTEIASSPESADIHLGFGFSYVFKKAVWQAAPFLDMYWNQDTPFIKAAVANGFKLCLVNDNIGICVHIIHDTNVSNSYPQYRLPQALIPHFFPNFQALYL